MTTESPVVAACLLALGKREDCRVWRNNTGTLPNPEGRPVSFGLVGSADISGIANGGKRIEFECKRPKGGKHKKNQKAFGDMIKRFGGLYALVKSADEATKALDAFLCS